MADVVKEKLALLRTKLDQIPALEQAEVSFSHRKYLVIVPLQYRDLFLTPTL